MTRLRAPTGYGPREKEPLDTVKRYAQRSDELRDEVIKGGRLVETSFWIRSAERETGLEPATCCLEGSYSTVKPCPHLVPDSHGHLNAFDITFDGRLSAGLRKSLYSLMTGQVSCFRARRRWCRRSRRSR